MMKGVKNGLRVGMPLRLALGGYSLGDAMAPKFHVRPLGAKDLSCGGHMAERA